MEVPIWCRIFGLDNRATELSLGKTLDNLDIKYIKLLIAKDTSMICAGWSWIAFKDIKERDIAIEIIKNTTLRLVI